MSAIDTQREALRQQMLLRALWRDARPGVVEGWLRDTPAGKRRGLAAYRANAGALAERALGAAYPTVVQLLGAESFAALARAFWQARPPLHGDIGEWGADLASFVAADAQLASEPYLADVSRLDWAVHQAERADDDDAPALGLERLADSDPSALQLQLRSGMAVVLSEHPVASIWLAHRSDAAARFDQVREAFAQGRREAALVQRDGVAARVRLLALDAARFTSHLLAGHPLGTALDQAGPDFDFEAWLIDNLRHNGIRAVVSAARGSCA